MESTAKKPDNANNDQNLPIILIVDFCDESDQQAQQIHPIIKAIFDGEAAENILANDPADGTYKWRLKSKYFEADL